MANPLPLPIQELFNAHADLHLVFPEEFYKVFLDKNNGDVETATKHISLILDLLPVTEDEYVNAENRIAFPNAISPGEKAVFQINQELYEFVEIHANVRLALQFAKNVRNASVSLNEILTLIKKANADTDGRSRAASIRAIIKILNTKRCHEILRELIETADYIMEAANYHDEYIELHGMTWKAALALFEKRISGMLNEMEKRGVDVVYALTGPGPKSVHEGIIKKKVMEFLKNNENKYKYKVLAGNQSTLEIRKKTT